MVKAAAVAVEPKGRDQLPQPDIVAPPSDEEINDLIAHKVSEGIAAALPAVLAQIMANQAGAGPQFGDGMGPSQQVIMTPVDSKPAATTFLKHYRKDDAINGKHQMIDVSKLVDGQLGDPDEKGNIPGVLKGQWIQFTNGDFYATKESEVEFVEWLRVNNPMSRIYEVQGRGSILCEIVNCGMSFASEQDLNAHKQATHGLR